MRSEWTKIVNTSVFLCSSKGDRRILMMHWIRRPVLWLPISLFPQPVLSLPKGDREQSGCGGRRWCVGTMTWTPLTSPDPITVTAEFPICQRHRSALSLQYGAISWGCQLAKWWLVDSTELPPLWKGKHSNIIDTLDMSFPPMHTMFLPKLPSVDLGMPYSPSPYFTQHCFWSRNLFHSKSCVAVGPRSWNPLVSTCSSYPLPSTQHILKLAYGTVPHRPCICSKSMSSIRCCFSLSQDPLLQEGKNKNGHGSTLYYY